ncbi:hypothetical protein A2Z33_04205 [Candidatus Gottesmanbacteria bacterium RBG_16_52_11]|uniref:Uncharacterized protein n=1 Tax=Candidatus Gottesmanbacteria bacterium RBG_16_52_11 TaxID=1798374 RepID=A0A1F5YWN7_9BACT|nr:MAG: hypothetical protein A2Z33_04205 [Candidatus Gottesmanbacteria bacterium RBG_16_52_11]
MAGNQEFDLTGYKGQIASAETIAEGQELDFGIIEQILNLHAQLSPDQQMVLEIDLPSLPLNDDDCPPGRYAGTVYDAPTTFSDGITQRRDQLLLHVIGWEERLSGPSRWKIVIPPNRVNQEELGQNTSASRTALTQDRRFLNYAEYGTYFLEVNIDGRFPGDYVYIHPSLISDVRIEKATEPQSRILVRRAAPRETESE